MNIESLVRKIKQSTQHSYLYHFSDEANFQSIRENGLLSKNEMRAKGFWPVAPSGNQWSWDADDQKGVSEYVSLCMTRNHPMKYVAVNEKRISRPRWLYIDPDVLLRDGVARST